MIHKMNLQPVPFQKIADGTKTIEMRLNDEKRRLIKIGDTIEFSNSDDPAAFLTVKVMNLFPFASFAELYDNLPLLSCGYSQSDLSNASPDDMNVYYTEDQQKKYGVLGIEINLTR